MGWMTLLLSFGPRSPHIWLTSVSPSRCWIRACEDSENRQASWKPLLRWTLAIWCSARLTARWPRFESGSTLSSDSASSKPTTPRSRSTLARPVTSWSVDPMSVAFASMSVVGGDGGRNAPISRDREGQSHLLAKPQACEKGVEHAGRRDPRSQPGRGRGGLAASDAEGHLIVDVKSSFDALRKGLAGFRWDGRSALEMAIAADAHLKLVGGCRILRCPRTVLRRRSRSRRRKLESTLIKTGHFSLVRMQFVMQQRAERPQLKFRS